jgi:epoxide hydrolase 4
MDVQHECIEVNGVVLHVAGAGPKHGRLVILLHGFPEYWEAWEGYFEPLVAAPAITSWRLTSAATI